MSEAEEWRRRQWASVERRNGGPHARDYETARTRKAMSRQIDELRAEVERLRTKLPRLHDDLRWRADQVACLRRVADAARALYDEAVKGSRPRTGVQHNGRRMSPSARQAVIRALGPVFDEETDHG